MGRRIKEVELTTSSAGSEALAGLDLLVENCGASGAKRYCRDRLRHLDLSLGPQYLIPKPFDPRLIVKFAPVAAKAVMDSTVAKHPT